MNRVLLLVFLVIQIFEPRLVHALQWPSPSSRITTGYGWRIHPTDVALDTDRPNPNLPIGIGSPGFVMTRPVNWHNGIDMSTNGPKQLKAVASGKIESIKLDSDDKEKRSGNRIKAASWQYLHLANSNPSDWLFSKAKGWDGEAYTIDINYFAIRTEGGLVYYSTESKIELSNGERKDAKTSVTEGHFIAVAGATGGTSTGIHLHLINYNGGDPTKSPLIDLYNAKTGDADGYNPPVNNNDPC